MPDLLEFHRTRPAPTVEVRPVDPAWVCQRSGDCCRKVDVVTMTQAEAALLQQWADQHWTLKQLGTLKWDPHPDNPRFVQLQAGPCPFLAGKAECTVHDIRPYNCRRFGCLRPDPASEPLKMAPLSPVLLYGTIGCSNLRERLMQSRVARRIYALLQRKGMRWALQHGWTVHDDQRF